MRRGNQLKVKQLMTIIIAWIILGFVMTVYDHLVLHTRNSIGTTEEYSFFIEAIRNMGAGLIGGILGGGFLVFYINVKFQDKPYGYTILAVAVSFLCIVAFVTITMGLVIVPLRTHLPLSDATTQHELRLFLTDSHALKATVGWSFIVAFTQLLLQVNSKFGTGTFVNIIRGKYNIPKEEKRIFMFLDLNSSTGMAERLGDEKYHRLLKDFFADITNPVLDNKGEIYQYVGDEVVVAWKHADGTERNNCIQCFFDIKAYLESRKDKYLDRYGLVPTFKAGIHCGSVVAGEIGIIKRDITYSGDVLNTTARILGKCAELNEEVIASSDLLSELNLAKQFISRPLGEIRLRGKEKEVLLNALVPA